MQDARRSNPPASCGHFSSFALALIQDLLSFANVNGELRREADYHFYRFLVPDLNPTRGSRRLGTLHHVDENRGFGYLTVRQGLHVSDVRTDVFLYINDLRVDNRPATMDVFLRLKSRESLVEFERREEDEGRARAVNATDFSW